MNEQPLETQRPDPAASIQPHRGTLILVLGILSLVVCNLLGIFAWIMGRNDLAAMRAGRMDRSGQTMTNIGQILGIIGTVLIGVSVLMGGIGLVIASLAFVRYREAKSQAYSEMFAEVEKVNKEDRAWDAREDAKASTARAQIKHIDESVQIYKLERDEFPATLQELTRPNNDQPAMLTSHDLIDPWKRPYKYDPAGPRNKGLQPDIWTDGPQGDGIGRIGNWNSER